MNTFLERLKAKNLAVQNIIVRIPAEDFKTYGEIPSLLMYLAEADINIHGIPNTAVIVTRPNTLDDRVIYRILWRKDGNTFSKGFLDKELSDKVGAVPAKFHEFIQGVSNEKDIIISA